MLSKTSLERDQVSHFMSELIRISILYD